MRASGRQTERFELKIMTTNNGSGFCGMRGARRGKRISYIIIYSNIPNIIM